MRIHYKKSGLIALLALFWAVQSIAQSSLIKQANRQFDLLAYANAVELYEQALKSKSISAADKQTALLKLGYSYRQVRDTQNAERVYHTLLEEIPELQGDDVKSYLYYAQALASNGKYKESQEAYDRYMKFQTDDNRSKFSKLYNDVSRLTKNSGSYKVEYLNINSGKADFSPMYYKNGLVFVSGRGEGAGIKRIFNWDKSAFLDLYYLNDLSAIGGGGSAGLGGGTDKTTKKLKGPGRYLGNDEYTAPTANDSRTVGVYGGTGVNMGLGYEETPLSESDRFSKTLNSKYHEGPATFTRDGSKVIFTRNNYNNGKYKESSDGINKLKIYTAEEKAGSWGNIQDVPFNSDEYSVGHPALSKDDKYMVFASDMPGGFGGTDLYIVSYTNGTWGTPVNLGKEINSKGNEMFPYVDENGNLYFSSDGHPGLGDLDIFFSEMRNGTPVGKIFNLGAPINSPKDDFGIITDGERKTGYFSSSRKRGGTDDDIYRFTREGPMYPCRDLTIAVYDADTKMPLDNATVDISGTKPDAKSTDVEGNAKLCLEDNQEYMFKATRSGYQANTIGFSLKGESDDAPSRIEIPLMKIKDTVTTVPVTDASANRISVPGKVSTVRGIVRSQKDSQPMAGVTVILKNDCDGSIQQYVTGPDGRYEFDVIAGCDYTLEAMKDNFGTKGNKIKKVKAGEAPPVINSDLKMFEEGDIVQIENIYYNFNSAMIRSDAARELDKVVAMMKKYPKMRIELRSHTDSRGNDASNMSLSDRRAKCAVAYLKKKGIRATRLEAHGYGESQLVNECANGVTCTEEQHQQNRRTEFKVLQLD
ncbi:MAG: OmpA family protein [Spirosomataceae bacterium]